MKAHIVSLGCPKNLTDSEVIMGNLRMEGYELTSDPSDADTIIVNTCSFLKSAREESLAVIEEMSAWKGKGKCGQLLVAGCLPKYLKSKGKGQKAKVKEGKILENIDGVVDSIKLYNCEEPRIKATQPWFAYVKISEGCNNLCAYCLIPSIRGRLRTRTVADVLKEVKWLSKRGVKEIIFVAQDTTAHPDFPEILKKTARIKGVKWIRVMYSHPYHLTDKVIDVIAKEKKIVKYIDLPVQHASDRILKAMNRKYSRKDLEELILKLRTRIPGIAIRTSVIVGFPGESAKDFNELKDFVKRAWFDRLGAFPYSREEGTPAAKMKGQVKDKDKKERIKELMGIQARISKELNRSFIGKKLEVLIEGKKGASYYGRSYRDAPEIDGKVFLRSKKPLKPGMLVNAVVSSSGRYDISAKA